MSLRKREEVEIRKGMKVGLSWLVSRKNTDCGWGPTSGMPSDSANTSCALRTLNLFDRYQLDVRMGTNYLVSIQSRDGGWGLYNDTEHTVFCTAISLLALKLMGVKNYSKQMRKGMVWLKNAQNKDGSWGMMKNSSGTVHETFQVIRALSKEPDYRNETKKGLKWLLSNKKRGGGWGYLKEGMSNAHLTSEVIGLLSIINKKKYHSEISTGINWLKKHQNTDGSWPIIPDTYNNTATQFYNLLICGEEINYGYMQRTLRYLMNKQLSDGSWPSYFPVKRGSVNVTSMTIRALALVINKLELKLEDPLF